MSLSVCDYRRHLGWLTPVASRRFGFGVAVPERRGRAGASWVATRSDRPELMTAGDTG